MLLMTLDKFQEYAGIQYAVAIAILGIVFILLGWLISRLFRPSGRTVQQELYDIKKELLNELNTAKKFNAEYQQLVKKETENVSKTPEQKKS